MMLLGKEIKSVFLPAVGKIVVMAYRTEYDGKTIFVGAGISDGDRFSQIGFIVFEQIARYSNGNIHVVQCVREKNAKERAKFVVSQARNGDGIFIACRNSKVIDVVLLSEWIGISADDPIAKNMAAMMVLTK